MDEKELLKKAFEYGNVPSLITYCFTEPCPMKDKCIHYLSGLYKNEKTDRGDAIFPNALKNGNCKYFAPLRVAPTLRAEMRSYLGSKGQYYRYKLGQLKLLPEQQKYIKQLFARYGYKDVEFEHFSEEIDFTNI